MNKLLYLSNNDIPFPKGQINIHPPKIKQIAFIGQELFFLGINTLCFSKDNLKEQDKTNLKNKSNFDVLMSIMNNKSNDTVKISVMAAQLVLSLIFPEYQLVKMPTLLILNKTQEGKKEQHLINNDNFEQFKDILEQMFCLNILKKQSGNYNPSNKLAEQIANKLKKRHQILSKKNNNGNGNIEILSKYISILVTAHQKTYSEFMQYTVYQLFDEFRRFEKKYNYDIWLKSKLAGAENLDDVESWLSDDEENVVAKPKSNKIEFS